MYDSSLASNSPQDLESELERGAQQHLAEIKAGVEMNLRSFRDDFVSEIFQKELSDAEVSKLQSAYPSDTFFVLVGWQEDLLANALVHDEKAFVHMRTNDYMGKEPDLTNAQLEQWLNEEARILREQEKCNQAFALMIRDPSPSKLLNDVREQAEEGTLSEALLSVPPSEIYQRLDGQFPDEIRDLFRRKKERKQALQDAIEQGRVNQRWANGCMQLRLTQKF